MVQNTSIFVEQIAVKVKIVCRALTLIYIRFIRLSEIELCILKTYKYFYSTKTILRVNNFKLNIGSFIMYVLKKVILICSNMLNLTTTK